MRTKILLSWIFVIIAGIILAPLALVGFGIGWPALIWYSGARRTYEWHRKSCFSKFLTFLCLILVGIILLPVEVVVAAIALILAIVPGTCLLCAALVQSRGRRRLF